MITKPMLAATVEDTSTLPYPLIASPKLDGIRCLKIDGRVVSRKFKDIPNHYIRTTLEKILPDNIDGEILVGKNFQECSSGVMSRDGDSDFLYWVFDYVKNLGKTYEARIEDLRTWYTKLSATNKHFIYVVPVTPIATEAKLLQYEQKCLSQGYEGVMLRTPDSLYKCGRSTLKQAWLLKLKRFTDSEAKIIGFVEQQENTNTLEKNELGYAKRSSAKAGKKGKNTLGKFFVEEVGGQPWKAPFHIGTGEGLTDQLRQEIWDNQKKYLGRIVKYKFQDFGIKDAPRLPIFLGFRDKKDM